MQDFEDIHPILYETKYSCTTLFSILHIHRYIQEPSARKSHQILIQHLKHTGVQKRISRSLITIIRTYKEKE